MSICALFTLAIATPAPVPPSMLQGNRIVVERYNFSIEAPRFDYNWTVDEEKEGTLYTCDASGDPLQSLFVFVAKGVKPGELIDEKTIERELRKGLTGAGMSVEGTTISAVRPGASYNFIASLKTQGVILNALGVVATAEPHMFMVFQFQKTTDRSAEFRKFVDSFTLLKAVPGPGEAGATPDAGAGNSASKILAAIGGLLVLGLIAVFLVRKDRSARSDRPRSPFAS